MAESEDFLRDIEPTREEMDLFIGDVGEEIFLSLNDLDDDAGVDEILATVRGALALRFPPDDAVVKFDKEIDAFVISVLYRGQELIFSLSLEFCEGPHGLPEGWSPELPE